MGLIGALVGSSVTTANQAVLQWPPGLQCPQNTSGVNRRTCGAPCGIHGQPHSAVQNNSELFYLFSRRLSRKFNAGAHPCRKKKKEQRGGAPPRKAARSSGGAKHTLNPAVANVSVLAAQPKSMSVQRFLRGSHMMLGGLTSRCTYPAACRSFSRSATCVSTCEPVLRLRCHRRGTPHYPGASGSRTDRDISIVQD